MSQWKINTAGLVVLICVIFLMLLIVVLPDVDLPDAAFHNGTAPVAIHAHATSPPAAIHVIASVIHPDPDCSSRSQGETLACPAKVAPNFRPILLRSIRC